MLPPLGPIGPPGPGPPPPTVFVSCCDICARDEIGSKEDVDVMGPFGPWLGLMGMLSGLFILHGPGKGPGRLVLFGPPDSVVSLFPAIESSMDPLAVVTDPLDATLQLFLTLPAHDDDDDVGA